MKKLIAILLATIILVAFCVPVSANNYKYYNLTDTDYKADDVLELNDIDDGLRQAINDECQNFYGCQVTFWLKSKAKTTSKGFDISPVAKLSDTARLTGNGMPFMSDTVSYDSNYITFNFDNINYNHAMWGMISKLDFECTEDVTITDVYIYVPEQPQLEDISAGAPCYEITEELIC